MIDYDQGTYYSYSPWSGAGSATGCYFVYDTSHPASPTLTSGDYPRVDDMDPNDPSYDGVGRYGTFTVSSSNTDVAAYWYGVNEDPSADNKVATTSGAAKTVSFRPTRAGTNFLYVTALDKAGNASTPATYQFKVKQGQPVRAEWKLDDPPDAVQATGSAASRKVDVHGGAALGVAEGRRYSFDGADDYLQSDIPTVDTSTGFSIAAWVKLEKLPDGAL